MKVCDFGLDTIEKATGEKAVNAIGYCVGGTLLSAALALFAKEGEERIKSATLFTTQVDFTHAGDLKVFVDEDQIRALENAMSAEGYLDGTRMATAFNMLRSGDLIWPYVINNYMRGRDPVPFDLLYWNADATRMSAANHSYYLRNCYLDNNLVRGMMKLAGENLSLADVKIPIYNLAAKEDHIAPALSVFTGCQYFGGDVTYVLAGSGHIAGVVNPPAKNKYQYWTGGKPVGAFDEWLAKATEHPGSWWKHWEKWIESQDETRVPARNPAKIIWKFLPMRPELMYACVYENNRLETVKVRREDLTTMARKWPITFSPHSSVYLKPCADDKSSLTLATLCRCYLHFNRTSRAFCSYKSGPD